MIVCKKCGNQNPDGETFCASCNAYLEWSGEKVVEPPPPAPPPPAPVEPGLVERVKSAVGLDQPKPVAPQTPPTSGLTPPIDAPPGAPTVPTRDASSMSRAAVTTPLSVDIPAARAAPATPGAGVIPRAADVPPARLPQAVAPAPERPRPPPKTDLATGQRYKPGDLICGQCGAGNNPERHFCQRCGANLSAAVVVKTPWYRKLFPARQPVAAGTRPTTAPVQRAWGAALFRVVAAGLIVLVVLAYFVVPPVHSRVNDTVASVYAAAHRHFKPEFFRIRPLDVKGSSELAIHPARLTIDAITDTYWAANTATDKQPTLRFTFATPVDFNELLITSGAGNDYATLARPQKLHFVFSDKSTADLTIKDDPNPQTYDLVAKQTTFVEIHIVSIYPSAQSPDVAINEVEFINVK